MALDIGVSTSSVGRIIEVIKWNIGCGRSCLSCCSCNVRVELTSTAAANSSGGEDDKDDESDKSSSSKGSNDGSFVLEKSEVWIKIMKN